MLGVHVKKVSAVLNPPHQTRKTLAEAIRVDCSMLGLNAAQIFSHGPRNHSRNLSAQDIKEIKALSNDFHVSVHSSYPSVAIWKLTHSNANSPASRRILSHIKDQLECCAQINATGLVIHISRVEVEVIREAMEVVAPLTKKTRVPIWLEMISSRAHDTLTYETPRKLNALTKALEHLEPGSWGICVDTAHVWGSGTNISEYAQMQAWFQELTGAARKKISMFHLNGSSSEIGSGKDKHEIAFCRADAIYHAHKNSPDDSGVKSIIDFCGPRDIPVILEINRGSEADTISCINKIAKMEESRDKKEND
jgi:endonuclease IV